MGLRSARCRAGVLALAVIWASGCDDAYRIDDGDGGWPLWRADFAAQPFNASVYTLLERDGVLYAGGAFTRAGESTMNGIARWDGTAWTALLTGVRRRDCTNEFCIGEVHALASWQGLLVAAGRFTVAGPEPALCIAAWDDSLWRAFGAGLNGEVQALASYRGQLVAGGAFTTTGAGAPAPYLAIWDGVEWLPFGDVDGPVSALAAAGDDLFVAGLFEHAGGRFADGFARFDGAAWHAPFVPGSHVAGLYADAATLLAWGAFAQGTEPMSVARWSAGAWEPVGSYFGAPAVLCALAGGVLAGKGVGSGRSQLFRLEGDEWRSASSPVDGQLRAAVADRGGVVVGGTFLNAGSQPARFIARWEP